MAGINAWIVYKETSGINISRQQFLLQLAEELAEEYNEIHQKGKENEQETSSGQRNTSRKTCQIRFCKDNKTTKSCMICKKYVCGKCMKENHQAIICKKCK